MHRDHLVRTSEWVGGEPESSNGQIKGRVEDELSAMDRDWDVKREGGIEIIEAHIVESFRMDRNINPRATFLGRLGEMATEVKWKQIEFTEWVE